MQADKDLARRLGQLNEQARKEREDLAAELNGIRSAASASSGSIGVKALKTASVLGLSDPKVLLLVARTVIAPAALGVGKKIFTRIGARRSAALALLCAAGVAVGKGIAYDRERKKGRSPEN